MGNLNEGLATKAIIPDYVEKGNSYLNWDLNPQPLDPKSDVCLHSGIYMQVYTTAHCVGVCQYYYMKTLPHFPPCVCVIDSLGFFVTFLVH